MTSLEAKHTTLKKILGSEEFREKDLYQKLLTYLVKASLKDSVPKEVTIAQDVFGKGEDFNASLDTTIRVYVHNLRNKLQHYYESDGKDDPLQICIPKGHYRVEFITPAKPKVSHKTTSFTVWILSVIILFLAVYILIDKLFLHKPINHIELIDTNTPIWRNFFSNGYPNSIVIGDFMVFHEYNEQLQRSRRIQDYQINSLNELDAYIKDNPNKNIETWLLGELPHNSIFNIIDLNKVFLSYEQKFDISFSTEIDINFIKNRNILYIGEFKNLRALSDLISKLPIKYQTLPWWQGMVSYQTPDSLVTLQTSHDFGVSRYVVDLGIVAKIPGSNNENYIIFGGFGYDSQIKIVELFSTLSSLTDLEKQIKDINGRIPDYFAILFEVRGFDRASTTAEMKFFHEIENDYYKK